MDNGLKIHEVRVMTWSKNEVETLKLNKVDGDQKEDVMVLC